jgi:hypothetical protein
MPAYRLPGRNKVGIFGDCPFEHTGARWHTGAMNASKPALKKQQLVRLVLACLGAFVGCLRAGQLLHWSWPVTVVIAFVLCGAAMAVNLVIRRRQGSERS